MARGLALAAFLTSALAHGQVQSVTAARGGSFEVQLLPGGRLHFENATLRDLIGFAWGAQVIYSGGEAFSERYDLVTRSGNLQAFLTDRFHLQLVHRMQQGSVYNLTAARPLPRATAAEAAFEARRGRIDAAAVDMKSFVRILSGISGRPVIDKTGIAGNFAVHLEYLPDDAVDATGPDASIFSVLEEKLGLRLESARGQAEVIVVKHAEKPALN